VIIINTHGMTAELFWE